MNILLHELNLRVLNAASFDELRDCAQEVIEAIGFKHYMYLVSLHDPSRQSGQETFSIGTYPEAWIECYMQKRYHLVDPTAVHVREHHYPLPWRNATFAAPRAAKMYAEAKSFGISAGLTCPVITPRKEVAGLGIARPGDADEAYEDSVRALPHAQLLTSYLHEAALRLLCITPEPRLEELTPRETQCLNLAAQGIGDGAIANRLGVNIRTVRFHLANVRLKLGAKTRTQMIARGIEINAIGL